MIGSSTAIVEYALAGIHAIGLPFLFVVFVLKGALVGKVFPTSVFLPGYVVAIGATPVDAVVVVVLVTVAHVVGQLAIYLGLKAYGDPFLDSLPGFDVASDADRLDRLGGWFDRYGGLAVFATNVIPWSRGLIAIPAGVSGYSTARYTVHVSAATVLYHGAYVAAALVGVSLLI